MIRLIADEQLDNKFIVALNRQVRVLPKLYNAVLFDILWGTFDFT